MKKIILPIITLAFCCVILIASASEILVRGRVVEANSGPEWEDIVGATVHIKNSTVGSVTNTQGLYIIRAGSTDTLVFSAVGYITQEIPINNKTTVNVFLEPQM